MAIDATQVMSPNGPLDPAPGEDSNVFGVRVQILVTNAYADPRVIAETDAPTKDAMAKALASYNGLMAAYRRMLLEPNTVTQTEKGSHAYTDAQRQGILDLANAYLAEFEELLPVESTLPANDRSSRVTNVFTW